MSSTTLRKLLNERYFEELKPLGYRKSDKRLSPIVYSKFKEIWGDPINETE
jgi:hypothetical protein